MVLGKNSKLKDEITEHLQQEKTKEMREEVARERRLSRAAQIDEIEKGRYVHDERSGKDVDRWERVISQANTAMRVDGKSYNTFQTVMFDLIEMYTELNEAIFQDLKEIIVHTGHLLLDGPSIQGLPPLGLINVYDAIGDKIKGKPEVVLPKLQYLVEATDEGKLIFDSLKRYENDKLGDAINKTFEQGVGNWLKDLNYKETQDGKWIHESGEMLNQAKFVELKNDPDKGLSKILSEHFELDLEERPSGPNP